MGEVECQALTVHSLESDLVALIKQSWVTDAGLQKLILELQTNAGSQRHHTWQNDELRRKGRLVIGQDVQLWEDILKWLHSSATGAHSGKNATIQRRKAVVYWRGMSRDVKAFIQRCSICQQCKYDTATSPGLLQPLPIPNHIWQHITMNFIDELPPSYGKNVIFVVVDRLRKATHFMALSHPYKASNVAQSFLDHVFKLHGFPDSIISHRDPIFVSNFWQDLMAFQGVQVQLSSAYHP